MLGLTQDKVRYRPVDWKHTVSDHVQALEWTASGAALAVAPVTGNLVLLDRQTGATLWERPGHPQGNCALSASGYCLASAGQDGMVRLWDSGRGELLAELESGARQGAWCEHVKFSPDGQWLAATAGPWLRIWREKGDQVFEQKVLHSTVAALEWRPDSGGLAVGGYNGVSLFRMKSGIWGTQPYEELEWKGSVLAVAWSPSGRYVAAGSQESTIQFWKLPYRHGEALAMSGYATKVRELAWDTESRWLASGGGELVTVWDVRGRGPAGTRPRQLEGHTERVSCLKFQRKGTRLASGGRDRRVCIWDLSGSGDRGLDLEWSERVSVLEWSPDGGALAVGGNAGGVQIWENA